MARILCPKTWDKFKESAITLHPNSVTYFLQTAPLSKPPIALRIFFTSKNVLYVFLDSAKGDAFRQTKIPIKQVEKQRYILHQDIKEFITKEFGRPDLVVISPMESPARYLTSLFILERKRLVGDRDVARDTPRNQGRRQGSSQNFEGGSVEVRNVKKRTESRIHPELASTILRTVPIPEAFLFFTGIGQYTGEFAPSLSDSCEKLKTIHLKSIEFHFKRRDFERWVRETLGDEYLANRISKIDRSVQGEDLRKTIQGMVKSRLDQLKVAPIT